MKRVLVLVAVLAVVGAVSADTLTLFWSTTGINNAAFKFNTTMTNFQPSFVAPTPVPYSSTDPTVQVLQPQAGGYDLFLWGTFPTEYASQTFALIGLDLNWYDGPNNTASHTAGAAYREKWGSNTNTAVRWNGSAGIELDGVMAAVQGTGIINDGYEQGHPYDYVQTGADGLSTFLLGATHVDGIAGQIGQLSLDTRTGAKDIKIFDPYGVDYPDPIVAPATFMFTPEPMSIVLVLAGLLLRRR